jgi:hypothetical protein
MPTGPAESPAPTGPHSSRGPGHRPLKAETTGSNPVCGTSTPRHVVVCSGLDHSTLWFRTDSNVADPLAELLSDDAQHPSRRDEYLQAKSGQGGGRWCVGGRAYWGIRSGYRVNPVPDGLRAPPDRTRILAEMPTRLTSVPDERQRALINWGYAIGATRLLMPRSDPGTGRPRCPTAFRRRPDFRWLAGVGTEPDQSCARRTRDAGETHTCEVDVEREIRRANPGRRLSGRGSSTTQNARS